MKYIICSITLFIALNACTKKVALVTDQEQPVSTASLKVTSPVNGDAYPWGTNISKSAIAIQGAYQQFVQDLRKNPAITIVAEVDHSRNAKSVGLDLNFEKIVFFGNPALGTPLMQKNQLAGLDLPQKVLFYKTGSKENIIMYNSAAYLNSRYGLESDPALQKMANALMSLVTGVSKTGVMESPVQTVAQGAGIISKVSTKDFNTTYNTLRNAIASNPNLNIVAELDHQENAASVNLTLRPTRVIIFGNPKLGTPLMQTAQSFGLDLPQKMLVWEDENGKVNISYNDIYYLQQRHHLAGNETVLATINQALNNLATTAGGL